MEKITAKNVKDYVGQEVKVDDLKEIYDIYMVLNKLKRTNVNGRRKYSGTLVYVNERPISSKEAIRLNLEDSMVVFHEEPFESEDCCYDE